MLTTDDRDIGRARAAAAVACRERVGDHVAPSGEGLVFEEIAELGFNYRMSDLQAAVGVAQL